ncbi:MAG: Mor transcription activator family protein [Clostridia bacterium]|nr:Mor transcription activator family protein [Clostridia bacterium]
MKDIRPEQLQSVYADLCSIVGTENMLQIYTAYKGQQISFPQRLFSKEYTEKQILADYESGKSVKEISKQYSYSYRWVLKLIHKNKKTEA